MKALRKRWRRGRRVDAEQWQRTSGGALREGSPNLRRDRGSRADGGDGERRDRLIGAASGQDLPHSRPRRTEWLRGKEHGDHGGRHDPLLPPSVLFVGAAGAGDGDRTGSRSAQVTGLLPALSQARGREVPARQWQDPDEQSRRTNRLLLACMPAESEVTRKWPGKQNGRSSRNDLSRGSARSRFSGKVLSTPGSPLWEKRQASMRSRRGVRSWVMPGSCSMSCSKRPGSTARSSTLPTSSRSVRRRKAEGAPRTVRRARARSGRAFIF